MGMKVVQFFRKRPWLLAVFFFLPVVFLVASHFYHADQKNSFATGYLVYDFAYYLSCAREYFDSGGFHFMYGNPFSQLVQSERIYFQPLTFLIGAIWWVSSIPLWLAFYGIGWIAAIACLIVVIRLYDHLFSLNSVDKFLGLICFVWGGGLLVLGGLLYLYSNGMPLSDVLILDPFRGWWFLNFGRNMLFPTEAVYHLMVFSIVILILRKKTGPALLLFPLLSISHPFTGIQFLLIFFVWFFIEKVFIGNPDYDFMPLAVTIACLAFHVGYYLIFLPMNPEHKSLMEQWSLNWILHRYSLIAGYGLVGAFALFSVRNKHLLLDTLKKPQNRLFIVWFLVSFLLANHEWFITPRQPLHFTRGYVWAPLFFLGAPSIHALFRWILLRTSKLMRVVAVAAVLLVFLNDNIVWLWVRSAAPTGNYYTQEQKDVLDWFQHTNELDGKELIVSNDALIAYYLTVLTPLKAAVSHQFCTPFSKDRIGEVVQFFLGKKDVFKNREIVIIENRLPENPRLVFKKIPAGAVLLHENGPFRIFRRSSQ